MRLTRIKGAAYLGCNVWKATAPLVEQSYLTGLDEFENGAEAEVADLQSAGGVEQNVFRLEVAVAYAL